MLNLTNADYHSDTSRISKSGLDLIAKAPALYYEKYLRPKTPEEIAAEEKKREEKRHFVFGSALHTAVLEPEKFDAEFIILPAFDRRTKDGKSGFEKFIQENAGKTYLTKSEFDLSLYCRDAVWKHEAAAALLYEGDAEPTYHFDEPQSGAPCKIKPDFVSSLKYKVDLKTTDDASPEGFGKSAFNYRYFVQAPFYSDGFEYSTGQKSNGFVFIAVEKEPPYLVAVYLVPESVLNIGREAYIQDCKTYAECRASGVWPGYNAKPQFLSLPAWASNKIANSLI